MLADMSALPSSLQAGLVMPVKSTDHTPPTSVITSPARPSSWNCDSSRESRLCRE